MMNNVTRNAAQHGRLAIILPIEPPSNMPRQPVGAADEVGAYALGSSPIPTAVEIR